MTDVVLACNYRTVLQPSCNMVRKVSIENRQHLDGRWYSADAGKRRRRKALGAGSSSQGGLASSGEIREVEVGCSVA